MRYCENCKLRYPETSRYCQQCGAKLTDRPEVVDRQRVTSILKKLPGYPEKTRPAFYSTSVDFRVVLKNMNYNMHGGEQYTTHDADSDAKKPLW